MRRRDFIAVLGGAAAWPLAVRAQQTAIPVIGYISARSREAEAPILKPLLKALAKSGFVVGRNVEIEFRFAKGQYKRLPGLVAELVRLPVSLIIATERPSAAAAKAATSTIPIVFTTGGDPVKFGFVTSLNRPASNATGVYVFTFKLGPKRLEFLREVLPKPGTIAFVADPNGPVTPVLVKQMQAAARAIGQPLLTVYAGSGKQVDTAFAMMAKHNVAGILYGPSLFFQVVRGQLVSLAARYGFPAIYELPDFVTDGGLMSYSANFSEIGRLAGMYAGRVLKGEKPADLPVVQTTKFELAINLKTARALGITVPPSLVVQADKVIE